MARITPFNTAVLAILLEGLQDELWRGSTGEVKTNDLHVGKLAQCAEKSHRLSRARRNRRASEACALTTKSTTLLRGAVSIVGTTMSEDVTAFALISMEGTLDCQGIQSPVVIWTSKSMRELSEFMSGRSVPVLGWGKDEMTACVSENVLEASTGICSVRFDSDEIFIEFVIGLKVNAFEYS